ncbi:Crp/Fnr family transcriptional regulator [Rhodobacteraceae bacterium]|nr:Crp/Fnr family transcriptional regulator [Paracoccaceae bacterium]
MTPSTTRIGLPKSGLFAHASPRLVERLSDIASPRHLDAGAELFCHGDPADAVYFIEDGQLDVSILTSDGRKLSLDILQAGDVVGEIALFDDGARTATITAKTDVKLRRLSRRDMETMVMDTPELALDLLALAGSRMRWLTQQVQEQALLTLQERLARKILHLTTTGAQTTDSLVMSQAELAEFLAVTREAVSKTLTVWKQSGVIELSRGRMEIRDRAAIRIMAGVSFF